MTDVGGCSLEATQEDRKLTRYANSEDWREVTRMATARPEDVVFGIALYEGAYDPEREAWVGRFFGNTGDADAAQRWVDTGQAPEKLIRLERV